MKSPATMRKLPLFIAVLGCLYGGAAMAQTTPPQTTEQQQAKQEKKPETEKKELEAITVTGSLIRRKEYDTISPVQVITADTAATVGQVDTAQILQQSSIASGSTQINHQFGGFVVEGGTGVQTISLRGLGANRTLVLLNGARPGPAGTRGQVGAFDLNVIPSIIINRVEMLKDGSSSIYGSDAVAGVANIITRKNITKPEFTFTGTMPQRSGGESYTVAGAMGWNMGRGNFAVAGSVFRHNELNTGDRDFLRCSRDLFTDAYGNSIDRQDRSILAGTELGGCNNMLIDTVFDLFTGARYVPAPDGRTVGLIPGYRPRGNRNYSPTNNTAYYEDVLNADFLKKQNIINKQQRSSLFATMDLPVGENTNWTLEALYTDRKTSNRSFRQFFPVVGGRTAPLASYRYENSPNYVAPVPSGVAQPVMPMSFNQNIHVKYFYVNTGFDGLLPFADWSWAVKSSYSRSKGTYESFSIRASTSGDVTRSDDAPTLNYFDPGFLNGSRMAELDRALGVWHTGQTTYNQFVINGVATGKVFSMPAGDANLAIGSEYRRFDIDDQPSQLSRSGDLWGETSAQVTKGKDSVREIFGELEVPILKGKPGFESLTANASARTFKYDTVEKWGSVWKLGLSWQIIPSFRVRATKGTSYRAPGLYELYLGNQSGFLGQRSIDPCVNWVDSTNDNLRRNCAAAGIPDNYNGPGASATVYTGGGVGRLKPETSKAFTSGFVWTPSFAPISIAVDYFSMQVNDQIGRLGAFDILSGCYGAPVYPNNFCSMFTRNPANHPTDPNKIETVQASYVNINKQKTRGYDLLARYDNKFAWGRLEVEAQATKVIEGFEQLFSTSQASGFSIDDWNGYIARPSFVGSLRVLLKRGDWSYTWNTDYTSATRNLNIAPVTTYLGRPDSYRDIRADGRFYHTASVRYGHDKWAVLVGVRNLLNTKPPVISSGVESRYGNMPAFATQYDLYGRSLFARFNYNF